MKVFEYDENQIKDLQKKSKIGAVICAVAGFVVCLILFLVHSRSNTIIILPIVCIIAAATVCVTLGIVLGRLGYLKQYGFIVKKSGNGFFDYKTYIYRQRNFDCNERSFEIYKEQFYGRRK